MKNLFGKIVLTTLVVLFYVTAAALNASFALVFLLFMFSITLLWWVVFGILKDNHTTSKTFDDYYYGDVCSGNRPDQ